MNNTAPTAHSGTQPGSVAHAGVPSNSLTADPDDGFFYSSPWSGLEWIPAGAASPTGHERTLSLPTQTAAIAQKD